MKKLKEYGFRKGTIIRGIFLISAMFCAGLMFSANVGAECVSAIAGGGHHSIALKTDGTVWACGYNLYGQLGDGTTTNRTTPVQVSGLTDVSAIAAGGDHSIALKSDGTVWAWGRNLFGKLGDGTTTDRTTPVQVSGLTSVIAIAGGGNKSIALKSDGTVWAWGYNAYGQLGDGTTTDRYTPVQVSGLTGVIAIAGGGSHNIALKADGTVWTWGRNNQGQLGDGTTTDRYTPVQVSGLTGVSAIDGGGEHSIALKSDGTVWAWGDNTYGELGDGTTNNRTTPVQVSSITSISAIAASNGLHSIALKNDGTVWAWGYNLYGQVGDGTTTDRNTPVQVSGLTGVSAIAGAGYHSIAMKSDGTVWTWGRNSGHNAGALGDGTTTDRYTPVEVSGLTCEDVTGCITAIADGELHTTIALKTDGTVWAWGYNGYGQLGDGTTTNRYTPVQVSRLVGISAIAGGAYHSIALKADGTIWEWGYNAYGQLGDGTTTNRYTPVQVSGLTGVIAIAGGGDHSIALKSDGTVWTWGRNNDGQLGNGTTTNRTTPVQVSSLTGISAIAGGGNRTIALKTDGTVWACGANWDGELGDGTTALRTTPVQVSGLTGVSAIAGKGHYTIALKSDGTVWAWGDNGVGELGDGTTTDRYTPVQVSGLTGVSSINAGGYHAIVLKADGTIWTWGYNLYGQIGDGTTTLRTTPVQVSGLTSVSSIDTGVHHTLVLKTDGTVWAWGYNGFGQLGDGTTTDRYTPVQVSGITCYTDTTPNPPILTCSAGNTVVNLDWADNVEGDLLGYNVYRSTTSGSGYTIIADNLTNSSYQDTGLVNDTTYCYVVTAVDTSSNESGYSNETCCIPRDDEPPSPPTGLTATAGNQRVCLDWNDNNESDLAGYNIYRSTTQGSACNPDNKINTSLINESRYCDEGLTNDTTYYYVVTAKDTATPSNESGCSSEVSAMPRRNPPDVCIQIFPNSCDCDFQISGTAPLTVNFAVTATDDGSIVRYEWDFEGDGRYAWSSTTGGNITYTYSVEGTYTATVRVTDNDGLTATCSCIIIVIPPIEIVPPTCSFSATPTSGIAPLEVTFTYSGTYNSGVCILVVDGCIQKYEIDFDGNGTWDFISTSSGSVTHEYGECDKTYTATLRVTDIDGLSATCDVTISVDCPTGIVPLVADANCDPSTVTVGETVMLIGSATGGSGTYIVYIWDYEGDGEYDWASTDTGTTSHIYEEAGPYSPTVMVIDSNGLSDTDSASLTVSSPSGLKVWISQPKNGDSIWGTDVTLHANTAPGNLTKSVKFQYKGATTDWADIGSEMFSPPYSFFATTWDVTGLEEGDHQLRAVGKDTSDNTVNSEIITITVTQTNPDIEDGEDENGNREKKQKISKDETTESSMEDNTSVEIPYGTLTEDATLTVTALTANPKDTTEGANTSLDNFRQIELEGNPTLQKDVTITVPYADTDNDGIVDGTNIPEKDLKLWWYNTTTGKWEKIVDTEVDTTNKKAKAKVGHLSDFAIGSEDTASPSAPSGLTATAGDGQVSLTWTNPTDTDFAGVKVIRKTGGYPASVTDGTEVYSGTGTSATDTGLTNGTACYYSIFAYDEVPNYSTGAQATATPQAAGGGSGGGGGGGCFIATAAYGTPMAGEVMTLCDFRDAHLLTNPVGRRLVAFYYRVSPPIADFIAKHEHLRSMVRFILKPMIKLVE